MLPGQMPAGTCNAISSARARTTRRAGGKASTVTKGKASSPAAGRGHPPSLGGLPPPETGIDARAWQRGLARQRVVRWPHTHIHPEPESEQLVTRPIAASRKHACYAATQTMANIQAGGTGGQRLGGTTTRSRHVVWRNWQTPANTTLDLLYGCASG